MSEQADIIRDVAAIAVRFHENPRIEDMDRAMLAGLKRQGVSA